MNEKVFYFVFFTVLMFLLVITITIQISNNNHNDVRSTNNYFVGEMIEIKEL